MINSLFKFVVESYQNTSSTGSSGSQPQMNIKEGGFVDVLIELGKWLLIGVSVIGSGCCYFAMRSSKVACPGGGRPHSDENVNTSHSINAVEVDNHAFPPPPPYRELPESRSTEILINARCSNYPSPSAPPAPISSDLPPKPLIIPRIGSSTNAPIQQTNLAAFDLQGKGKVGDRKKRHSFS